MHSRKYTRDVLIAIYSETYKCQQLLNKASEIEPWLNSTRLDVRSRELCACDSIKTGHVTPTGMQTVSYELCRTKR